MSLFPKQPDLVGIDAGTSSARVAALRHKKRGLFVIHLKEVALGNSLKEAILKDAAVCTAICPRQVLVRPFQMQLTREKDIRSALDFQVESLLPFPSKEALVEAQVIERRDKGSTLTICAIKKEHLKKHLDAVAPLEPEAISCVFSALAAFSALFPESAQRLLLIHIGEEEVACALCENGNLLKAHAFEKGEDFEREIKKTALSLAPKAFESVYLLGSEDPFYLEAVKKATGETPRYPNIPSLQLSQERLVKFGLAIGTALASKQINFRKKEFAYPYPLKRLKKPLMLFAALSLLLTCSLFSLSALTLSRQKTHVLHAYQTLLASVGKVDANVPKSLSEYSIELQKIEKEVMGRPDTFPLLPAVPKVRETLSFLTTEAQEIEIQSFRYQMVKRPSFNQKKEKYQIKVDLEFVAKEAAQARQLHEKLLSPNAFIDPKREVSWESSGGLYKSTFFLKDKTRYHG